MLHNDNGIVMHSRRENPFRTTFVGPRWKPQGDAAGTGCAENGYFFANAVRDPSAAR
jgi:hypothetical protein